MSTYLQWRSGFGKNGAARITWVCGQERVLVNEVCGAVANYVSADYTEIYTAGQDREKHIWAAALSIPTMYKRLIVVRDAGRLRDWDKLHAWLASRQLMVGCWLLFDSSDEDFPRDGDGKLAEPATWLRDSTLGQLVRCTQLGADDAAAWACARLPGLTTDQARRLVSRASGNLAEVRTVLAKARVFSGRPDSEALDLLCSELPGDFADLLITGDRKGAMLAAETLGTEGLGWSLGLLASRLEVLATLHRAAAQNVSRRDVTGKLGVPAFLAQKYAGVARDYGEGRVARCWAALAAAEDAYRSGVTDGVAEVLVVSW